MELLANAKNNALCTIKWMLGLPEDAALMMSECNISPGSKIQVVQNSGGSIIIRSGSRLVAMDHSIAQKIRI